MKKQSEIDAHIRAIHAAATFIDESAKNYLKHNEHMSPDATYGAELLIESIRSAAKQVQKQMDQSNIH